MKARHWTIVDEIKALDMHDRGCSTSHIAQQLGRSERHVDTTLDRLIVNGISIPPAHRPCICCDKKFLSDHKFNRMCSDCKKVFYTDTDQSAGYISVSA